MFNNKKLVRLDLKMESGHHRLVVDYFDAKDKMKARKFLYEYLTETYGELLLQVDSNFINKRMDGKEGTWMEALIHWGQRNDLMMESFKFKREVAGSVLGGLLGSKIPVMGYRVGILIGGDHILEAVSLHHEIDMGVHIGCGIKKDVRESLLGDFCGGRVDEFTFSDYYAVDFYDYDLVGRCVMKCAIREPLEAAKEALESRLLCFKSN